MDLHTLRYGPQASPGIDTTPHFFFDFFFQKNFFRKPVAAILPDF